TGIGWHESRVPTIATTVPRAAYTWVTRKLRSVVKLPLVTTNRINMPHTAEAVLARGDADMISMARPFLADPDWVNKAAANRADEINTCIGCNQACLDHVFQNKVASCLVNPRACHETELLVEPVETPSKIAVIGAGPAGLAAATTAAERGHKVTLFDQAAHIGGQFNMAKRVPGKEEFVETLRYFSRRIELTGIDLRLGMRADVDGLTAEGFDEVIIATGVTPRDPRIPGQDHPSVLSYVDVLLHNKPVGQKVAVIGAGGIGFDVSEFLVHAVPQNDPDPDQPEPKDFFRQWGVDMTIDRRGGVDGLKPEFGQPAREVYLLQRKTSKPGQGLGKTTGWIHRASLKHFGVKMLSGVSYERIDDAGLHIRIGDEVRCLEVDNIVICAGQVPNRELAAALAAAGIKAHLVGGADVAAELDAKRAIDQGTRLAASI
ncbi:MAG: FAD-dependent oxidoreductase, partial [Wenzhouxiangella sp.]